MKSLCCIFCTAAADVNSVAKQKRAAAAIVHYLCLRFEEVPQELFAHLRFFDLISCGTAVPLLTAEYRIVNAPVAHVERPLVAPPCATDPPGDCLRIRLVVAILEGCGSYFVRGSGLEKLSKFVAVFQR